MEYFNEDYLILSEHYAQTMENIVLPFLRQREKQHPLKGFEDRPLYCVSYPAEKPRGTVLIVHGFTENAFKYAEIIYSLLQNSFSVVAYDQRGHGRSWRKEGIPDVSLTHVDHFSDYVRDMEIVVDQVLSHFPKPWTLFTHSMGGAVSSLYLVSHPDVFARAALCAPMIAPNRNGVPLSGAKLICHSARLAGRGKDRLFASKPFNGPEEFSTSCATSKERFDWYDAIKQARKEFQNNGPSYTWTLESLRVTKALLASGAPEKIACPVLLFTAEQDNSVLPEEQKAFISRVPKGKQVLVKNARHEIFRSEDSVLFPWWRQVLSFLKENP